MKCQHRAPHRCTHRGRYLLTATGAWLCWVHYNEQILLRMKAA